MILVIYEFILKNFISKCVKMKTDGGFYIAKRILIRVTFTNDDPL